MPPHPTTTINTARSPIPFSVQALTAIHCTPSLHPHPDLANTKKEMRTLAEGRTRAADIYWIAGHAQCRARRDRRGRQATSVATRRTWSSLLRRVCLNCQRAAVEVIRTPHTSPGPWWCPSLRTAGTTRPAPPDSSPPWTSASPPPP